MAISFNISPSGSGTVEWRLVQQRGTRYVNAAHTIYWQWSGNVYELTFKPKPGYKMQSFDGQCTMRTAYYPPRSDTPTITTTTNQFNASDAQISGSVATFDLSNLGTGAYALPAAYGAKNEYIDNVNYSSYEYTVQNSDVVINVVFVEEFSHKIVYDITSGKLARNASRGNKLLRDSP